MLKINSENWFDLNKVGIFLVLVFIVLFLFVSAPIFIKLIIEAFLIVCLYLLIKKITRNNTNAIMVNSENQWFVESHDETIAVELKDYWLHTQRIFIWLHGSNTSLSLVLTRRIIGEQNFSLLRSKIQ